MYTIGLDVGGTSTKGGLLDPRGEVLRSESRPTERSGIAALLDMLRQLALSLAGDASIGAVGVGLPGLRSSDTGRILVSPNLTCLEGANVEEALGALLDSPVFSGNDADMSAWGEFSQGAGAGTRHMIALTLGTGVGSGLILDGQLYGGSRGYASEAGHITVEPEGLPCSCGNLGCLEAVASATGIVSLARAWLGPRERTEIPEPWTALSLHKAALGGHKGARRVFEQAGGYLGIACATLINLLNPEAIVLAGGVIEAGDLILSPAIREARARAFRIGFEACRIVPAELGNEAGVIGAALFARHRLKAK